MTDNREDALSEQLQMISDEIDALPGEVRQDAIETTLKIVEDYRVLAELVGSRTAHRWLCQIAEDVKPPPRTKRVHDPKLNAKVVIAYLDAPEGQRLKAATAKASELSHPMTNGAVLQLMKRWRQRGLSVDEKWYVPPDKLELVNRR